MNEFNFVSGKETGIERELCWESTTKSIVRIYCCWLPSYTHTNTHTHSLTHT